MKKLLILILLTSFILMGCTPSIQYNVQSVTGLAGSQNEEEVIITTIGELEEFIQKHQLYLHSEEGKDENKQQISYEREFFYKNSIIAIVFPASRTSKYSVDRIDGDSKDINIKVTGIEDQESSGDIGLRGFFIEMNKKTVDKGKRIKINYLYK